MKKLLRLFALLVVFTLVFCSSALALSGKTTCLTHIKSAPDKNAEDVASIKGGKSVGALLGRALDSEGVMWYLVSRNGKVGYVESSVVYVKGFDFVLRVREPVYVRKDPSPEGEELGSIPVGRRVYCTGVIDGGWVRMNYGDGFGWVYGSYLK